ncbi:MAG TPA: CerR family C-terminal domain-containing protein [Bryobacteraceae bacterium]|jgi:AcrR family transcriptional regulator
MAKSEPQSGQGQPDPTRAKLLEAAGEVFAEHGFQAATVREICSRARANVAAVNYYFGDKSELYAEVLRQAVCTVHDPQLREALSRIEPEEALRRAINHLLHRLCDADRPNWAMLLMTHEMANPTPALARVVGEVIGPNYGLMRGIIGRMLGLPPDHVKTRLCAHSVVSQILHYKQARAALSHLWPDLDLSPAGLDRIADHIAEFSLAYLKKRKRTS